MAVKKVAVIDQTLTAVETLSGMVNMVGITPKRVSIVLKLTKTLAPPNLTLKLYVSPDEGVTFVQYDKILTDAGTDAPVSSVVYSASADDMVSVSLEDVVDFLKVELACAAGTVDGTNYWVEKVWAVIEY